jgi:hypothetical protein
VSVPVIRIARPGRGLIREVFIMPTGWLRIVSPLALVLLLAAASASATVITHEYSFTEPIWSPSADGRARYEVPNLAGARTIGQPGEPLLPVATARILLPPGEDLVDARVIESAAAAISLHLPAPAEFERPLSESGPYPPAEPRAEIYGSDALFPAQPARAVTVQTYRGHRIAYIDLFPLRVRPASGAAEFCRTLTLEVTTAPSAAARAASARTYRDSESTRAWLARHTDDPEWADAYRAITPERGGRALCDPADTYLYVIVTSSALAPVYEPLAADRTAKGLPATIVTMEDILANYAGVDSQERLRNFILDAYQSWETDYVLLGADTPTVPDRDLYCYVLDEGTPTETNDLCSDLYYEGLDGTWNTDGDDRWGEPEEADLLPEVHTARFCADNASQVQNFITKLLRYERQPVASEIPTAAFFGEYLWEGTYGDWYMEEIRLGASTWGYTTAGVPPDWTTWTFYEETGSWSGTTFINQMNSGTHMCHHLGHANSTYDIKVYDSDVPSFTANGVTHTYNVGYSQGCDAGAFDEGDCIMEDWVKSPTGFVSWVGNTRYGFGVHYTTNGSSQYYHRQFVDALWSEGINELGGANDDSRADNVGYIDYESNRWVHYEITAFGDPAMPIWTRTPRAPLLTHAGTFVMGQTSYAITVRAGIAPIRGARVCMWDEAGTAYDFGETNLMGAVTLHPNPTCPGTMHIVVSDADLLVTDIPIPIVPDGAFLVVDSQSIDDSAGGDGDGACDAGETIDLTVTLRNVWTGPVTGVSATLACASDQVTITDGTAQYGDFAGGQSKTGLGGDHFAFHIAGTCPDQTSLPFTVTIRDGAAHVWTGTFAYTADAPALSIIAAVVDDAAGGDGDGMLDPGESVDLTVTLANTGHTAARQVAGVLASGSGDLTVTQSQGAGGDIPIGGQATLVPDFALTLEPDYPEPGRISCTLVLAGGWELSVAIPLDLQVGGFHDDMEAGEGTWTHAVVTAGFVDQWHLATQRNHTPGGGQSWKFGASGTGTYASLADGALITAPITVRETTRLTFWHWIDAEVSSAYPGRCYDGGIVEMSLDGGAWTQITPEGGYPFLIRAGGNPGPFPVNTPCFSGTQDWRAETFSIDSAGGSLRLRFRFGSDGATGREGWYIDDVEITSWSPASATPDAGPVATRAALGPNRPNPFAPATAIEFTLPHAAAARLLVLDAQGRVVRTLLDGPLAGGPHRTAWDGRDGTGREVGSGVYFYRLETEDSAITRKMTRTR